MYMFRSRRSILNKRLCKARCREESQQQHLQAPGQDDEDKGTTSPTTTMASLHSHNGSQHDPKFISTFVRTSVLKRLKEQQLELLVMAVEGRGAEPTPGCVLVPREPMSHPDPALLCCQMWRWPDLRHATELKRLPVCRSANDPVYTCVNPYHWSRLCRPESPPPPYCRFARERLKPEDRAPSEGNWCASPPNPGSLTTNGDGSGFSMGGGTRSWCRLAYWEMARRVGPPYPVENPFVNVFAMQRWGDGLCLETLANHGANILDSGGTPLYKPQHLEQSARTRAKIGLGMTLSHETDGVWVYNRSEYPIFVNTPTLDDPDSRTVVVFRVPPGHCLNIFNREAAASVLGEAVAAARFRTPDGPIDPYSVRISFAKGWGPKYSRREVTGCPCWIEVLLAPCR